MCSLIGCCCDCAAKIACCCCTCALQTLCCMVFVVVIICLAIGLGVYFGVFHNRDSNSSTTTTTPSSILLNALLPEALRDEKEPTWVY
ncbi:protein midgut expression 1-like isoform X1 [Anopheles coustani]|uniref:protein midgut expression 1-like isoform X1 n=1 Tax=Anopheles coustani TaxID=139045 RepID=UPI00265AB6B0|nr:protein midgut expression 1-like isoform X1 [Anopheles coustani]